MKVTTFNENDSVLLVGEGNFSFSVVLSQFNLNINITSTCYESSVEQEAGKKNIEYLRENGIRVILGVDATNLKEHCILKNESFDKIIFNFPHVGGKMRIEKNRELLQKFFIAAEKSLKNHGQVLVTLCNGQGGTPMDEPQRRWDDSWKIAEMAAHGNFILAKVEPFIWSSFDNYIVTGYRSLDKQFHSDKALTHCFTKFEPPNIQNIAPKNKINVLIFNTDQLTWKDIIKQVVNTVNDNSLNLQSCKYAFDITVCVNKKFNNSELYIMLYNYAGNIINDINFIRSYVPHFQEKERRTYRISYKSNLLPLYRKRIIHIHQDLIANILEDNLSITVIR